LLSDQTERALRDQQTHLARRDGDLRTSDEHIRQLEDQLVSLKRSTQVDRDEAARLRATIAALDREKDQLQVAVDEKTEAEVSRQDEISDKVRRHAVGES